MTAKKNILVRFFLNASLLIMSFLVPKRKGQILLGSGLGKRFMGNPKYVFLRYLELKNSNSAQVTGLEFYWITESEKIYRDFIDRGWPVIWKFSFRGYWKILRADFLVAESGMMATQVLHDVAYAWLFLGRFKVIQTWHGTALKLICLDALKSRGINTVVEYLFYWVTRLEYSTFDCVIAQSDYDSEVFNSAFGIKNLPVLGSARNDIFHNTAIDYENLEQRLNFSKFDRVILYAPTYREARASTLNSEIFQHREEPLLPFTDQFIKDLDKNLSQRNWLMLVKKHHLDKALTIQDDLTNIADVGQVDDIQELLVHSDVLVTDYSSVFFDFLQADKPIVYYVYDLKNYINNRGVYIDYSENIIGPFAKNESELSSLLFKTDQWFYETNYRKLFLEYRHKFQKFDDGRNSDRLINYISLRNEGQSQNVAKSQAQNL